MNLTKYGTWRSNGVNFYSKFHALVYASKHNTPVIFNYHDHIWENFDRNLLGKISLKELYKQQALRLRQKYDYLVLYYSGGADSHNILKTYIDNNIKIDEIRVKWPQSLIDGKMYSPNNFDNSASNYWSEWNFAVQPILKWIGANHPSILITIVDYMSSISKINFEKIIDKENRFISPGPLLHSNLYSPDHEKKIIDSGKSVGHIYGVDKPILVKIDNIMYMIFSDRPLLTLYQHNLNPTSAECFYWDPDFPIIAFEQAYQLCLYYVKNTENLKYLWGKEKSKSINDKIICNQVQNDIAKKVLYDNWDYRFQSKKPGGGSILQDKFFWFFTENELETLRKQYFGCINQKINKINSNFLELHPSGLISQFATTTSMIHKIIDLDKILRVF